MNFNDLSIDYLDPSLDVLEILQRAKKEEVSIQDNTLILKILDLSRLYHHLVVKIEESREYTSLYRQMIRIKNRIYYFFIQLVAPVWDHVSNDDQEALFNFFIPQDFPDVYYVSSINIDVAFDMPAIPLEIQDVFFDTLDDIPLEIYSKLTAALDLNFQHSAVLIQMEGCSSDEDRIPYRKRLMQISKIMKSIREYLIDRVFSKANSDQILKLEKFTSLE